MKPTWRTESERKRKVTLGWAIALKRNGAALGFYYECFWAIEKKKELEKQGFPEMTVVRLTGLPWVAEKAQKALRKKK